MRSWQLSLQGRDWIILKQGLSCIFTLMSLTLPWMTADKADHCEQGRLQENCEWTKGMARDSFSNPAPILLPQMPSLLLWMLMQRKGDCADECCLCGSLNCDPIFVRWRRSNANFKLKLYWELCKRCDLQGRQNKWFGD